MLAKRLDGSRGSPLCRSAPAGVSCGDDTEPGVREQDRRAIGDAHDDGGLGIVADDDIRLGWAPDSSRTCAYHGDADAVHLTDLSQAG